MENQNPNAAQNPPGNSQPIIAEHVNIGDIQNRGPIHQIIVQGNFLDAGNQPRPRVAHDSAAPSSNSEASWQEKSQEAADKVIGTLPSDSVPLDIIRDSQAPLEEFGLKGLKQLRDNQDNSTMLKLNQLFAAAKQEAIDEAKSKKFRNKAANDDYVERHGNVVGMTGIAGIGKTTAIKQTLTELVDELPADQKGYWLFKYLKTLDLNKPLGVLELLSSNPNWKHTKEIDDQILERLSKSNKLFIFLDGLDEPRFKDLHLDAPVIKLYDRATPMVILQNLLRGDILPNAHKLLTSRPGAFLKLHPSCKPHFVVKVIGFNESSQDLYFRQICPKQEDYEKVTNSLGQNPLAKAMCFLPIFAKTVAPYIIKHGTKDSTFTLTDVFAAFVSDCIHSPKFENDPRILGTLSHLALDGMLNDKITFDVDDLKQVGLDGDGLENFLNMQVFSSDLNLRILDGDKVFFFIHLLWQEFFTSLKLLFDTDLATFSRQLQSMESNTWEMVLRFLFGLLNTGLHRKLKPIFVSSTDVASKKRLLNGLIDSLGSQLLNDDENSNLFKLCSLAQESNDEEITAKVADSLPGELHIKRETILPSEVSSLCHVLRATQRELVISICVQYNLVTFTGNGLEMLMDTMVKTKHKMDEVYVRATGSRDFTALSTCVHKINRLKLYNRSDQSGFEVLTEAIARRETPMEELIVYIFGSRELSCLATSVHNINKLTLLFRHTTESNPEPLTDAISHRNHPEWNDEEIAAKVADYLPGELHIKGETILPSKVSSLCHVLRATQRELVISMGDGFNAVKFTGNGLEMLMDTMAKTKHRMELVSVKTTRSRDFTALSTCLRKINRLELDNEGDVPGFEVLTEAIARRETPTKELIVDNLGSHELSCLATSVHNINKLTLKFRDTAESNLQPLTDAISSRNHPESNNEEITAKVADYLPGELHINGETILPSKVSSLCQLLQATQRELVISIGDDEHIFVTFIGNGLEMLMDTMATTKHRMELLSVTTTGSRDFVALSTCVYKINRLWLESTSDLSGFEVLTETIARSETPLEEFEVWRLDQHDLGCLATSANNINKLKLWECDTAETNLQPLTDAISRRNHPMELLDLHESYLDSLGLSCLATSVHNINQLKLEACEVDCCDLKPLTDAISRMDRPLEKLYLVGYKLDSRDLSYLATTVHNINQLKLWSCQIACSDLQLLTNAISEMNRPMRKLDLSYNKLGSQGLAFLRTCAHNVQELELKGCGIGYNDVDSLRKITDQTNNTSTQCTELYQEKQAEPEASQSQETSTEQDVDDGTDHGSTQRSKQGSSQGSSQMSTQGSAQRPKKRSAEDSKEGWEEKKARGTPQGLAFHRTCAHNLQELELEGCGIGEADVDSLRKKIIGSAKDKFVVFRKKDDGENNAIIDMRVTDYVDDARLDNKNLHTETFEMRKYQEQMQIELDILKKDQDIKDENFSINVTSGIVERTKRVQEFHFLVSRMAREGHVERTTRIHYTIKHDDKLVTESEFYVTIGGNRGRSSQNQGSGLALEAPSGDFRDANIAGRDVNKVLQCVQQ